jgi:hypothetical protein
MRLRRAKDRSAGTSGFGTMIAKVPASTSLEIIPAAITMVNKLLSR